MDAIESKRKGVSKGKRLRVDKGQAARRPLNLSLDGDLVKRLKHYAVEAGTTPSALLAGWVEVHCSSLVCYVKQGSSAVSDASQGPSRQVSGPPDPPHP